MTGARPHNLFELFSMEKAMRKEFSAIAKLSVLLFKIKYWIKYKNICPKGHYLPYYDPFTQKQRLEDKN